MPAGLLKKLRSYRTLINALLSSHMNLYNDAEIFICTNMSIISISCMIFCLLFQKNDQTYLYPDSIVRGPLYDLHYNVRHAGCRLFICRDVL